VLSAAGTESPFAGRTYELDGVESTLGGLGMPAKAGGLAALAAGAALAGSAMGGALPLGGLKQPAKLVGGAAAAAGVAYVGYQANERAKKGAAKQLGNVLAALEDPATLQKAQVDAVASAFGVQDFDQELGMELAAYYHAYLGSILPRGEEPLQGWEAQALRDFMASLGLSDENAAQAHLEEGRRIFRQRMELDKEDVKLSEKEFQKLMYLSQLTFGEAKSRFLLPWKRLFDVSDAALAYAVKDNASTLFQGRVDELLPAEELAATPEAVAQLRQLQNTLGLVDDVASDLINKRSRERVERSVARAADVVRARARAPDMTPARNEVSEILSFNRQLAECAAVDEEAGGIPGVSPVAMFDESFTQQGLKKGDIRDVYKMYLVEGIKQGSFTEELVADMSALNQVFGLGTKEAEEITVDMSGRVYRARLTKAMADGTIDAAASPAAYLQETCNALRFAPQSAEAIHTELFRTAVEEVVSGADGAPQITPEKSAELAAMQKQLCMRKENVRAAKKEILGVIYEREVSEVLRIGSETINQELLDKVAKVQASLEIEDDLALELLGSAVRRALNEFIRESRNKPVLNEKMREIRKMVIFNRQVVTPLVEHVTEDKKAKAMKEIAELVKEAEAEAKKEEEAEEEEEKAVEAEVVEAEPAAAEAEPASAEAAAPAEAAVEAEVTEKTPVAEAEAAPAEAEAEAEAAPAPAEAEAAAPAPAEEETEEQKKERLAREEQAKMQAEMMEEVGKAQKVITLGDEMSLSDRQDLYKNFLIYAMTGETISGPMGIQVKTKRDQKDFARLAQLGELLGLSQMEMASVQSGFAEQAFKAQAEDMLADGRVTKDRMDKLGALQKQMGLADEAAQKIVKGITSSKLLTQVSTKVAKGEFTIEELEGITESGMDVEAVVGYDTRLGLYKKTVEAALLSGSPTFDKERLLEKLPADLKLEADKVAESVGALAKEKKKDSLIQAVSSMRQKNRDTTVKAVNNIIAAHTVEGDNAQPLEWARPDEVKDLFALYVGEGVGSDDQAQTLGAALGLADDLPELIEASKGQTFSFDKDSAVEQSLF